VLITVYDESGYDASLDYEHAVVPALTPADAEWVRQRLDAWRAERSLRAEGTVLAFPHAEREGY